MNLLGAAGDPQVGAPWSGGVDPAGGAGTASDPFTGTATIDVSAVNSANVTPRTQKLMPGWNTVGSSWKPLLIALGIAALGGIAYLGYRKYGHKLFRRKKGRSRRGRNRR